MKTLAQWALGLVCVVALLTAACGGGEDKAAASMEAQLAPLQEQQGTLEAKRAELADLKAQIAAAATAEPGEEEATGEEGEAAPTAEELTAQAESMQDEINGMSDDFMTAVVTFINSVELYEGEPIPDAIQKAINMKSAEDMVYAAEYIWKGGEYRRAIEILDTALLLDPNNAELQAARDKAAADQFMTEERFAAVAKGMTQEEVRAAIGTVSRHNLREYPDKNVVAWFYRREDRGAAGVWFEERDGAMTVYKSDFNAIEAPEEKGEGE